MYGHHEELTVTINTPADAAFGLLDDQTRLGAHMSKRSWKMGWGKMEFTLDEKRGQAVGSHIALSGRVFGVLLSLEEVVTMREPPLRKSWETVGAPHLLVIGPYRMGFELTPGGQAAQLRVWIDYDLPRSGITRFLGRLLARPYAKWCVRQMAHSTC